MDRRQKRVSIFPDRLRQRWRQAVAVQFVGPPDAESRVLWLAGEVERLQPWRRYAPVFDPTAEHATATS